ncbi:MAG: amino acid adenylation domain-containing protein [Clostridia bacterium]|nr:amino acid adenylation domain-containing protein [Clostridia bacterium]
MQRSDILYDLFLEQVHADPGARAVFDEHRSLTRGELDALAGAIAAQIPEDCIRVGVVMDHSVEMIAAILAAVKTGRAYVPAEPSFPDDRIRFMLQDAGACTVLTNPQYAVRFEGFRVVEVPAGMETENASVPEEHGGEGNGAESPGSLAYILYTSGSTGAPKGVAVTNANVCHYVRAFQNEFHTGPGDIMLQYSVCSFDIFVEEVFTTLCSGAALAIPPERVKADIRALMAYAEDHGVTALSGFPYLLLEMNALPEIPRCLRLLISGGDVLRAAYVTNLLEQAAVYNTYGPSETTVCASYCNCNKTAPLADGTYPIGKPVLGAEILVVDAEGREVPDGVTGELCILGGGVSAGYIGDREEENKAFEPLPDGRVRYRSGDLGYRLPDGNLAFLRRKDRQVMILGKRVEPVEVESVLHRCAGVKAGAVRAFEDDNHLAYLVAYYVPDETGTDEGRLRRDMAHFLAPYMIPEFFLELPDLPLNANGKVEVLRLPYVRKDGLVVEQAGLSELDTLMEWRMEVLHEVFGVPAEDPMGVLFAENLAYYKRVLTEDSHIAVLVKLDGEIIGCGGLCMYTEMPSPDNPSGQCGYLMNIYTREAYRHRGVGKTTVDYLLWRARARGIKKIFLETSEAGRSLYEGLGFVKNEDYLFLKEADE